MSIPHLTRGCLFDREGRGSGGRPLPVALRRPTRSGRIASKRRIGETSRPGTGGGSGHPNTQREGKRSCEIRRQAASPAQPRRLLQFGSLLHLLTSLIYVGSALTGFLGNQEMQPNPRMTGAEGLTT